MKRIFGIICLAVAGLMITGCSEPGKSLLLSENLKADGVEEITIDVSSAEVEVIRENRDDIYVEFETFENTQKLRVREGKKTLIETYTDKDFFFNIGTFEKHFLTVYVPMEYDQDLKFEMSSGSATIEDFNLKDISCDMSSGSFYATNVTAEKIDLDLSSGNVDFKDVTCEDLVASLSSGDVELDGFSGNVDGKLSSGNFEVVYRDSMGDLDFDGSSGKIKVDYSQVDVDGEFDLSTSSGDIHLGLELKDFKESNDGDRIRGTAGGGNHDIDISVSSGDIRIVD